MSNNLIKELFNKCRINNCSHQNEPGCAVLSALKDGSLSASQWKNYQSRGKNIALNHSVNIKQKEAFRKTITMHYQMMKKV